MNKSISVVSSNSNPNDSNTHEIPNLKPVYNSTPGQDALFDLDEFSRLDGFKTQKEIALEEGRRLKKKENDTSKCYFSFGEDGELLYHNKKLDEKVYSWMRDIHDKHIIKKFDRNSILEMYIFAVNSGLTSFERCSEITCKLRKEFQGNLPDAKTISIFLQNSGVHLNKHRDVYTSFENFVNLIGSYETFYREYILNPIEMRRELVKDVNGLGHKLSSFIYLMLGGHELMTTDVHVNRQLYGLGIFGVNENLAFGKIRKNTGRKIPEQASPIEYERIEREVMDYFSGVAEFQYNGQISGNLLTCLFWGAGTRGIRKKYEGLVDDMFETGSYIHHEIPIWYGD